MTQSITQVLTLPAMNPFLLIGGILSLIAALLHIGCIVGGGDWLRFFGGGDELAVMAENGSWYPGLITGFIAVALMVLGTYAFVGAAGGETALPLPFVKWVLFAITLVFLFRGAVLVPLYFIMPDKVNAFAVWSSLIVLALGIVHAIGLAQVWKLL